jgi:hypothetical protein
MRKSASTPVKFVAIIISALIQFYSTTLWANDPLYFIKSIGPAGTENGQFDFSGGNDRSGGVFFNGTYLYVTDWNNNRLQRFNADGTFKDWLGNIGGKWGYYTSGLSSTDSYFYSPLFVDTAGNVYIQYNQSIQKHNSIGDLVATFPDIGWAFRRFTIDANGNFFATGSNNNSISKYSPLGNLSATFGSFGVGNGQFNNSGWTVDIVCDSAGNVYMLDQGGKRVQKFSNTGAFLAKWTVDISGYSLMAIDENDMLYIMEDGDSVLRKYNTSGVLQKSYAADGVAQGGSSYIFVRSGKLYVSNGNNEFEHTIRIYSLSQTPNPTTQSMYGSVTITATVSYPQTRPTTTKISKGIKTETESSIMATYTISNAMVLQFAAQANLIPSVAGYSIICPDDWESGLEFFAYKKGSPLVSLSPIISFTESVNVQAASKITTTNLTTSAETVRESGTEKSYGTGNLNGMAIAVNRTINFKSGTVKIKGTNYSYYPSTTTGTFFGGSESGTMFVEGKFSVAASKPIDVSAQ